MTLKSLSSLILLFTLLSPLRADLRFDSPTLKLGEVRGGPDLTRQAAFVNRGTSTLEILDIERGCSCLQAVPDKRVLAPGEAGILTLHLRTLGHKNGPYAWITRLRYRIGDQVKETSLRLECELRNEVTLEPAELILGVTESMLAEILLTDLRDRPLHLKHLDTSLPGVTLEAKEVKPGTYRILVQVRGAAIPPGRHEGNVSFFTADPEYPHLKLPVRIMRSSGMTIQPIPERILVSKERGLRTSLVRLRTTDEKPLKIARVECPGLKCTWAEDPAGGAVLRLSLEGMVAEGAVLRVFLEGTPRRIEIPIEWE